MSAIATLTMNPALDVTTSTATIKPGHKLRCAGPREDPGGGGINVARAIHALGGSAVALYPSGGASGARITGLLERAGVPVRTVAIAGTTRESFTVDEQTSGRQYRFVLPGPELSQGEQARCLELLAELQPRPRWLVASGSLPPGTPETFLLMLGGLCRSLDIELLLDSSGPALARCASLDALLLKPSLSELEALVARSLPNEAEEEAAARSLIDRGFARAILVSLGARGALLATAGSATRFPAIPVSMRSTVGAGDSMLAAVTLALSRGWPLEQSVRLGIAAGAAALTAPGTSLASREDVERLFGGEIDGAAPGLMAEAIG
ncbi:1-phosphofructokinase family hexose kinase [Sphingomonas sp. UNC305MFCol5.2]|uniref:1-phosphofructokinase family hexose kinase n=1 Tax=Sphingomonas sp. UNC305MFCol5.2 TaxID=1449076 RepID=UPI00056399DE|nr:1-phosphofructokinase family hexose kinase [Sphingomonas sp. UNC305MFCol5.2]